MPSELDEALIGPVVLRCTELLLAGQDLTEISAAVGVSEQQLVVLLQPFAVRISDAARTKSQIEARMTAARAAKAMVQNLVDISGDPEIHAAQRIAASKAVLEIVGLGPESAGATPPVSVTVNNNPAARLDTVLEASWSGVAPASDD